MDRFPSPAELWARYCAAKGLTPKQEAVATQDYYNDGSNRRPAARATADHLLSALVSELTTP
jgi:type I site-specific restriction endonuclease